MCRSQWRIIEWVNQTREFMEIFGRERRKSGLKFMDHFESSYKPSLSVDMWYSWPSRSRRVPLLMMDTPMLCCNLFVSHSSSSRTNRLKFFYDFFFSLFALFRSFLLSSLLPQWIDQIELFVGWCGWLEMIIESIMSCRIIGEHFFLSIAFTSFSLHLTFFQQSEELKSVRQEIQISHWNEMMSCETFLPKSFKNFEKERKLPATFVTEISHELVCYEPPKERRRCRVPLISIFV